MYTVIKRLEISAAHKLALSYTSKCTNLHGHNWIITVYCRSEELNQEGMVTDFSLVKNIVQDQLDLHLRLEPGVEAVSAGAAPMPWLAKDGAGDAINGATDHPRF